MSITRNDDSVLFRTDAQIAAAELRGKRSKNKIGSPLNLETKILYLSIISPSACLDDSCCFYILFASSAGTCGIIDPSGSGTVKFIFKGHKGPVTGFSKISEKANTSDTLLASCGWDGTVKLWSLRRKSLICSAQLHEKYIKCMIVVLEGEEKFILTGGSEGEIRLTHLNDLLKLKKIYSEVGLGVRSEIVWEHARGVEALVYCNEGIVISCSSDGTIQKWSLKSRECLLKFSDHETNVCAISLYYETLFSASADRTARIWDLSATDPTNSVDILKHDDYVRAVQPIKDGSYLLTGSSEGVICVWDVSSGELVKVIEGHFDEVTCFVVVNHTTVYSGSLDGTIRKWLVRDLIDRNVKYEISLENQDKETELQISRGDSVMTKEEEEELDALLAE